MADQKILIDKLFDNLTVINVGLALLFDSMEQQGLHVVHVDWKPPAKTDEEIKEILDRLL